jgi:hypothetical protein
MSRPASRSPPAPSGGLSRNCTATGLARASRRGGCAVPARAAAPQHGRAPERRLGQRTLQKLGRGGGATLQRASAGPAGVRPLARRGTQQRRHLQHPAGSPGASRRARPRRTGRGGCQPARYDSRSRRRVDQRGQRGRQRAPLLGGGLGAGALARGTQHRAHADGARLCPRADLATRSGCWSHALGWREARACMPVGAHDSEQRCCAVRGSAAARPGGAAGPAPASP